MKLSGMLQRIVDSTRERIEARRQRPLPERSVEIGPPDLGYFREALTRPSAQLPIRILAEIKKASPSRGVLRNDFEPAAIAREYALNGADAISVLTEPEFFRGEHDYLLQARVASGRPCLMKDFVLDPFQIEEAVHYGADAVLLILALLDDSEFVDLQLAAREHRLDVLVEVHSEEELGRALEADSDLIGINNRDLVTFETDPQVTARLRPLIAHGVPVVSESGIATAEDIRMFSDMGIDAVLIGEHFMRAERPGKALAQLREAASAAVRVER